VILRINPPGEPVRFVELGPARGRLTANGGRSMGGPLEHQPSPWTKNAQLQRVRDQAERERRAASYQPLPRCAAFMPKAGQSCARRLGHTDCHKSAGAVQRDNARRRQPEFAA